MEPWVQISGRYIESYVVEKQIINFKGKKVYQKGDEEYFIRHSDIKTIFSSVTQLCPTVCDPMDCSTPGLPIHYQLLELAQTHVHQVGDAI